MYGFTDSEGEFFRGQMLRDKSIQHRMENQWDETLALIMFARYLIGLRIF